MNSTKIGGELRCSGGVSSYCPNMFKNITANNKRVRNKIKKIENKE